MNIDFIHKGHTLTHTWDGHSGQVNNALYPHDGLYFFCNYSHQGGWHDAADAVANLMEDIADVNYSF